MEWFRRVNGESFRICFDRNISKFFARPRPSFLTADDMDRPRAKWTNDEPEWETLFCTLGTDPLESMESSETVVTVPTAPGSSPSPVPPLHPPGPPSGDATTGRWPLTKPSVPGELRIQPN